MEIGNLFGTLSVLSVQFVERSANLNVSTLRKTEL